jgi:hypothetical protein
MRPVRNRKKRNAQPSRRATSKWSTRFAVEFFCPTSRSSQESEGFFTDELHTRAVEIREAREAVESARAGLSQQKGDVRKKKKTKIGGLSPQKRDVRKKRKRPRKVVCRHKKGT